MHPELLSSLAAERRRDLAHDFQSARRARRVLPPVRAPHLPVPKLRVTWSRTTLASAGRRRGRSYVIVISATRTL